MSDKKSKSKLCLLLSTAVIGGCLSTSYLFAAAEPTLLGRGDTDCIASPSPQALYRLLHDAARHTDVGEGKDIVVFLGETGAGKSTSINWLDSRIRMTHDTAGNLILDSNYPDINVEEIGITDHSQTAYPKCHQMGDGSCFVDFPGFFDTKGIAYDLINLALIKKVLSSAKKVKFIFVINDGHFHVRQKVTDMLNQLRKIYADELFEEMVQDHSLMLITRSDKFTRDRAKQKFESQVGFSRFCDDSKLCCIPKPDSSGETRESILKKIEKCSFSEKHTKNFNVGSMLSPESKTQLKEIIAAAMRDFWNKKFEEYDCEFNKDQSLSGLYSLVEKYERLDQDCEAQIGRDNAIGLLRPFAGINYEEYLKEVKNNVKDLASEKKTKACEKKALKHKEIFDAILIDAKTAILNAEIAEVRKWTSQKTWNAEEFKAKLKAKIEQLAAEHTDMRQAILNDGDAHRKIHEWRDAFLANDSDNGLTAFMQEAKAKQNELAKVAAENQAAQQEARNRDTIAELSRQAAENQTARNEDAIKRIAHEQERANDAIKRIAHELERANTEQKKREESDKKLADMEQKKKSIQDTKTRISNLNQLEIAVKAGESIPGNGPLRDAFNSIRAPLTGTKNENGGDCFDRKIVLEKIEGKLPFLKKRLAKKQDDFEK